MITIDQIAEAGVVGAGGAGFPTHVKLMGRADTVLVNAAECEPLLHKDKEIIQHAPELLVEGLARAMQLVGASNGFVGLKRKHGKLIDTFRSHLAKNMKIIPLDDFYPAGDEMMLVYETTGRVVPPGQIPAAVGIVVLNVETVFNLAQIETKPVTEKFLTVAGCVPRPCTLRVPVGISLAACLEAAGGPNVDSPAFVLGGVMMGTLETDLSKPVTKTTGGLIVLPKDHFIVERKSWDWSKTVRVGRSACDQCSFCTELCPRNLLGHPIEPHRVMRSLGFNISAESDVPGSIFCCECNLCSYCSCPEGLDPKNVCAENKRRIQLQQRNGEKTPWKNPPFRDERPRTWLSFRKTPIGRIMQKIGLNNFVNKAPLETMPLNASEVAIPLRQHVGVPCEAIVRVGDRVEVGQTIGTRPMKDKKPLLGADIHASIVGTIVNVNSEMITIR
ncbi:MAG: 4Fe-4S dicluster domain-containing protein [Thermoguttaceae bacterium]